MVTIDAGVAVECSEGRCQHTMQFDTTRAASGKSVNIPSMEKFIIRLVIIVKLHDIANNYVSAEMVAAVSSYNIEDC